MYNGNSDSSLLSNVLINPTSPIRFHRIAMVTRQHRNPVKIPVKRVFAPGISLGRKKGYLLTLLIRDRTEGKDFSTNPF